MEFRVLGSLEAVAEGRSLALGAAKQRALLAVLVLNDNRIVSTERLIDALWGEEAADGAAHTVQVYVSALRKALRVPGLPAPETILVTQGQGYVLRVEPETIDLHRFERVVGEGRRALAAGEPARAADLLEEALGLWRGPPLAEFAHEAFAQPDIARIEDLRLSAVEDRIEADLDLGRQAEVIGELRSLVGDHPLRERLRGQLMLALYRSGRQTEALDVFRDGRQLLVDELGIDPSPDLQRLERAILEQDPELEVAVPRATHPRPAPRRRRTHTAVAALVVTATLVVTAVVVVARTSESPPASPRGKQRWENRPGEWTAGGIDPDHRQRADRACLVRWIPVGCEHRIEDRRADRPGNRPGRTDRAYRRDTHGPGRGGGSRVGAERAPRLRPGDRSADERHRGDHRGACRLGRDRRRSRSRVGDEHPRRDRHEDRFPDAGDRRHHPRR